MKSIWRLLLTTLVAYPVLAQLPAIGIHVPVLTQIIGFIYISFIPGLLMLCILRMRTLGSINTILYSCGLSLAFQMFLGFLVNLLYPLIGISQPILLLPLSITWTIVLGLLYFAAYMRDRDYFSLVHFDIAGFLSPSILFFILLPLLSVLAGQFVLRYQNNLLTIILLCLISCVPILAISRKLIRETLYPLAIFSTSLSLLWTFALVSNYLILWDSFYEYYYYALVHVSGIWDWTVAHEYNAMLSITILPAICSQLLDMSGTAVFKIIYPLWYALLPLGLYQLYIKYYSKRVAFLAAFFFSAGLNTFYLAMPAIARQMIGELFCLLLILLVTDREVTIGKKALFVIFGVSLIISHYSLAYLYILFLVICLAGLYFFRKERLFLTVGSITLFSVVCLAWYMYTSDSAPLTTLVKVGDHIYRSMLTDLLNPSSRDVSAVFMGTSPDMLHLINRILWYLVLSLMCLGSISLIPILSKKDTPKEYALLAVCSYGLLGLCIVIPFFSNTLGMTRMLHIASIVLAPFYIEGLALVFRIISQAASRFRNVHLETGLIPTAALIISLFFLFSSTVPFAIAKSSEGRSIPLAITAVITGDSSLSIDSVIYNRSCTPTDQEVESSEWVYSRGNETRKIYATYWQIGVPALVSYGMISPNRILNLSPLTTASEIQHCYMYLGYTNTVLKYGTTQYMTGKPDPKLGPLKNWEITRIQPLLNPIAKVYANGASEIYWSR